MKRDWRQFLKQRSIELSPDAPLFILGPTAIGKSSLALEIAEMWDGEVVSMDAFQVYRGLDVGTGKVSVEEQSRVKHHLLDVADPLESFHVARYVKLVEKFYEGIQKHKIPHVFVGGTGLYYRALRQGLTLAPESKPDTVKKLEALSVKELARLAQTCDPTWAKREGTDLHNPRRLIRAVAVYQDTGKPLSAWQKEMSSAIVPEKCSAKVICLSMALDDLRVVIEKRVQDMWSQGWPEEVESLMQLDGWKESQSYQALGYAQVGSYLNGELSKSEAMTEISLKTGQFAKRQMTWWRKEGVTMLDLTS